MPTRGERLARGWAVGAVATSVAAFSHVAAGGPAPSWLGVLAGVVFAGMLGTAAVGRRLSVPRLVIAVGASQLAFHLVFSLLGGGTASGTAFPGHVHGAVAPLPQASGFPAAPVHAHDDGLMWAAHAAAAVATIAYLRYAEQRMWTLASAFARLLVRWVTPALPMPADRPRAAFAPVVAVPARGRLLASDLSRRGPPALLAR